MRRRYYWSAAQGEWIEAPERRPMPRRAPMVITDTVTPFRSMADGRIYESKSRYRAELKARGYAELGNEKPKQPNMKEYEPQNVERDIADAYDRLEAGHKPEQIANDYPEGWDRNA